MGVPEWTNETLYDINAKPAAGSNTSREQMADMLQALLADRFTLELHRETRATDGFAVVPVRRGTLGAGLKTSDIDCDTTPETARCRSTPTPDSTFIVAGAPMRVLIQELVIALNAPVVDETGLAGMYDFDLRWSADAAPW